VLSQIQGHAASLLEDLDSNEAPPESELDAMENSLDSMVDTYDDIKEMLDSAMDNFRRNNLMVVHSGKDKPAEGSWWTIQISVSGTDVWRRAQIPGGSALEELHLLIQTCLDWKNSYPFRFSSENPGAERKYLDEKTKIRKLCEQGITELLYEYGTKWNVKVIILSPYQPGKNEVIRCVAGTGAAPPEVIGGPLRFRRILAVLESGSDMEKQAALHELGPNFIPGLFDMETCNRNLSAVCSEKNDS
jgi:hypothetical protein